MKPADLFLHQPKPFWANVRTISQEVGYTDKDTSRIKVPALSQVKAAFLKIGLGWSHISDEQDQLTELGATLLAYFKHRAEILNTYVEPRLMDADKAKEVFERLRGEQSLGRTFAQYSLPPIPMNKQKGEKKAAAYFTAIINMLIAAHAEGFPCDYDPRALTTVTLDSMPLRTLARRVDGAFPSTVNPIAVWEIKEYYYTTTFGSRVADGVYETLLDGMELEELREHEKIDVRHYLMVDSHYT